MPCREKLAASFVCAGLVFVLALASAQADDATQATEALWLADHAKLVHKVKSLHIGDVDLENATIPETLDFLRRQSRIFDPDHQGINFIILTDQPELKSIKVSATIKHATVADVLAQIPVQIYIEDFVVGLTLNSWDSLCSRTFDVPDNVLAINPSMLIDKNKLIYDVRPLFAAKGIKFPPGTSATYSLTGKKLTAVATDSEQLIRIDELLVYGFKDFKLAQP